VLRPGLRELWLLLQDQVLQGKVLQGKVLQAEVLQGQVLLRPRLLRCPGPLRPGLRLPLIARHGPAERLQAFLSGDKISFA